MPNKLILTNQFGEEFINTVGEGTTVPGVGPIADGTAVANISGATDEAVAVPLQALVDKEPAKTGVAAIVALATANAATQTASYVQADVQSIATLANALKTQVNAILAALKVIA